MRRIKTRELLHRMTASLLCLSMLISMIGNVGPLKALAESSGAVPTNVNTREADPNTMETYKGKLLSDSEGGSSETTGSRYAGRVWSDKSVVAHDNNRDFQALELKMENDGYDGSVNFNADFLHIYSTLTSSQVVNEYPPSPIDLVIVFDMSGSMGQDTRYGIDAGRNAYVPHDPTGTSGGVSENWPAEGVSMEDRIKNSRIQATLNAINETIDGLMAQNVQNRVAVCGYGANATVLMPLAHYRHKEDASGNVTPYLSVGGMETLYHPSDLVYKEGTDGVGWYWMNNRDTCYTVVVNAGNEKSTYTGPLGSTAGMSSWQKIETAYTVSNNVKSGDSSKKVRAFPGVADPKNAIDSSNLMNQEASKTIYDACSNGNDGDYAARQQKLIEAMQDTVQLQADDYVGYFTNTQGGIYLAYKQLADAVDTTYSENLTTGTLSTVARIPAAIIMSDGGANFAFNEMGSDGEEYSVANWNNRYGQKQPGAPDAPDSSNPQWFESWYMNDNIWDATPPYGQPKDFSHRLGNVNLKANVGDEWYKVYLPGNDTLQSENDGGDWDGLHGLYNIGADYYEDGTLTTAPAWSNAGVFYSSDSDFTGTPGTVLQVLLTASYMNAVVKKHYENGWLKNNASMESRIPLSTYTMNVDSVHVPQWGRMRLYPTLDPQNYSLDTIKKWYNNAEFKGGDVDQYLEATYNALAESWEQWKAGTTNATIQGGGEGAIKIALDSIKTAESNGSSAAYNAGGGTDLITVTDDDILANMAYDERFYDVDSAELSKIFGQILALILGKVFVPVSGSNDAGVGNSITYQDPIGLYMEIKHGAIKATPYHTAPDFVGSGEQTYDMAMLLFGEMHGVVRTGVYDYEWIQEYERINGPGTFKIGWYKGEGVTAQKAENLSDDNGSSYPSDCSSVQDVWDKGWVMRLDYNTLAQYVPIVEGAEGSQTQNTVYTVYRFSCPQDDRNELRINPVYGDKVPDAVQAAWDKAVLDAGGRYPVDNSIYAKEPGVYRLSDIRVWTEDTGDYVDEEGVLAPNTGYDVSLYVNIPAAALPTQLAEITMGPAGVMSYKTNLGADHTGEGEEKKNYYYAQSTPFRLFYAVGVDDYLITRDENNNQTGINVAMLPDEYIREHTENGKVYFYSNYYSGSIYEGYGSDLASSYRTMGDPAVSFAAGADNRYYVFQRPLPLYAHAYWVDGETLSPVDRDNGAGSMWTSEENRLGGNGDKDQCH